MRKTKPMLCLMLAGCAAALASGCSHVRPPRAIREDPLPSADYPQIAVLGGLGGAIAAGDVVEEAGPPLAVTVPMRALTHDDELNVQYRFFFLNEKGVPLDRDPDWHYMQMPSRSQVFMGANALDQNARTWRLEVRPAR